MFCTFIGIASCTQKNERVEYVDPVEFSSKIFKGINYEYLSMLKKEKTEINLVYVKKKDMSKNYFNDNVIKEMKNEKYFKKIRCSTQGNSTLGSFNVLFNTRVL